MAQLIDANSNISHFKLQDEEATLQFAQTLAQAYDESRVANEGLVIYLLGDLGAGKSFFSRAFIQSYMPEQKVKSPTYTIVESYYSSALSIHHFDLYRLCDPEELEYLAVRDLLVDRFVALVEWPQKGAPIFPEADLIIELHHPENLESEGRLATIQGLSEQGKTLTQKLVLGMSKT